VLVLLVSVLVICLAKPAF